MESVGLVKVTWKGKDYELPAPTGSGRTLHAEVASQFGIPLSRLKMLLKGRTFPPSESAELVHEATSSGSRIMVLGTAASDHLDSMQNRARYGSAAATDAIMNLPTMAWNLIAMVWLFVYQFVRSMFVPPTREEKREAINHD